MSFILEPVPGKHWMEEGFISFQMKFNKSQVCFQESLKLRLVLMRRLLAEVRRSVIMLMLMRTLRETHTHTDFILLVDFDHPAVPTAAELYFLFCYFEVKLELNQEVSLSYREPLRMDQLPTSHTCSAHIQVRTRAPPTLR